MSLIIHIIVPEGIVVSSDTRTTIRRNDGIRYDDTANKTIPFPNNVVVSHCGDSMVNKESSVTEFLYKIRKQFGSKSTVLDLPLIILNQYKDAGGNGNTIFLISGLTEGICLPYTYRVETKGSQIKLIKTYKEYGAAYDGTTSIAHAIMNSGIDYENLSLKEAISLVKTCMDTNIEVFKYNKNQIVGGTNEMYIINDIENICGWLQLDGTLREDPDAPQDDYKEYQRNQYKKMLAQKRKERKIKNQ